MKQPNTSDSSLQIVRLGKSDWRVSGAEGELLGYIERLSPERYELVWMTDPMHWGYVESFDEAVAGFGASVRFTGEQFPKRITDPNPNHSVADKPLRRETWVKGKGRPHVA